MQLAHQFQGQTVRVTEGWGHTMSAEPVGHTAYYAPARRGGGIKQSSASIVRLSDVAYIGSNSKTKWPRKTKLCTGVPQVTCDSHTDFNVKRSKVKVTERHILWQPPSRTACYYYSALVLAV